MTTWAARAKQCFSQKAQECTPINPEMAVTVVLGVTPRGFSENERLRSALFEAAMRACDQYGDGEAAREQMRADCLAVPPHLQRDLLDHFQTSYPEGRCER